MRAEGFSEIRHDGELKFMKKVFTFNRMKNLLIAVFILASVVLGICGLGKTNVAVAASVSTWDGTSDTEFDGEGTKDNPYLITSAAELNGLRVNTNGGSNYNGVYFKLTVDIDLNSKTWYPIGYKDSSYRFKGHFDGDGHTVSNLSVNNTTNTPAGLFGYVESGSISNLGITSGSVWVKSYGDSNAYLYAGSIAGYIGGGTTVTNCYNAGCEVNGSVAGGIVGYNGSDAFAPIVNCYNTGDVYSLTDADGSSKNSSSGGIVGYSKTLANLAGKCQVVNCYNTGKSQGEGSRGRLIGKGETLAQNSYYFQDADSYGSMLESGSLASESSLSTSDYFTSASSTVTYKESASSAEEELSLVDALNKGAALYNATNPTVAAKAWKSVSGGYPVLALTSVETYSVTNNLDGLTASGESEATGGSDYTTTLSATSAGRTLPSSITVTVGGTGLALADEYSYNTDSGVVRIISDYVTGNIVITATAGKLTGEGSDGKYYLDGELHTHDFSGETGICACKLYSDDGGTTIFSPLSADGLQTLLNSNGNYIPTGNYYLTENVALSQAVKIKNGTKVKLALNGKVYDLKSKYITVESGGSLTILDKDRAGLITTNHRYYCIVNKGTLTVDGARVTGANTTANDQGVIVNDNGATATITNSTVTNESAGYAVNNISGATLLSIGDSTVVSEYCGIYHQSNSAGMYLYGDSVVNGKDYDIYLTTSIWAISKDGTKSYTGDDTITIKFKDTVSDGKYIVCKVTEDNKGKFLPMFDEDDLKNIDEAIVVEESRTAYGDVLMAHKHNYKSGVCTSCEKKFTGLDGDKYYVDGELGTGVYDGKYYKDGVLGAGVYDGKYYKDGVLGAGVYNGKYYENGDPATGTSGGVYYVDGDPATGVYDSKLYKDGELFTGTEDGVYYVDGVLVSGEYNGKVYENGVLFSGVYNNRYYENGVLSTGTSDGVYYVDGDLANGKYNEKDYVNGKEVYTVDISMVTGVTYDTAKGSLNQTKTGANGTAFSEIVLKADSGYSQMTEAQATAINNNLSGTGLTATYAGGNVTISGTPTKNVSLKLADILTGSVAPTRAVYQINLTTPAGVTVSGNLSQTIVEGAAIENIVLTAGENYADLTAAQAAAINTQLTSAGLTAAFNETAKTITISGTPTKSLTFNLSEYLTMTAAQAKVTDGDGNVIGKYATVGEALTKATSGTITATGNSLTAVSDGTLKAGVTLVTDAGTFAADSDATIDMTSYGAVTLKGGKLTFTQKGTANAMNVMSGSDTYYLTGDEFTAEVISSGVTLTVAKDKTACIGGVTLTDGIFKLSETDAGTVISGTADGNGTVSSEEYLDGTTDTIQIVDADTQILIDDGVPTLIAGQGRTSGNMTAKIGTNTYIFSKASGDGSYTVDATKGTITVEDGVTVTDKKGIKYTGAGTFAFTADGVTVGAGATLTDISGNIFKAVDGEATVSFDNKLGTVVTDGKFEVTGKVTVKLGDDTYVFTAETGKTYTVDKESNTLTVPADTTVTDNYGIKYTGEGTFTFTADGVSVSKGAIITGTNGCSIKGASTGATVTYNSRGAIFLVGGGCEFDKKIVVTIGDFDHSFEIVDVADGKKYFANMNETENNVVVTVPEDSEIKINNTTVKSDINSDIEITGDKDGITIIIPKSGSVTVNGKTYTDTRDQDAEGDNIKVVVDQSGGISIIKPKAIAPSAPTISTELTYGQKLSDITLPDGWAWVDGTIKPSVSDSKKTPYNVKIKVDNDNYDWAGIEGYADGYYTATVVVTVNKAIYNMSDVTFNSNTLVYDGNAHSLAIDGTLPNGVTVTYEINDKDGIVVDSAVNVGEYTITSKFNGDGDNYNAIPDKTATLTINAKNISGATVTLGDSLTYNGSEQKQTVTSVKIDDLTVTYTVSGNVGTNAESYTLTITANGNFTGSVTKTWSIAKATYNMNGVTFEGNTFVYDGKAHTLAISGDLPSGVTVAYENNGKTESGVYTVTAKFSGDSDNYEVIADMTATLTINAKNISGATVTLGDSLTYNGSEQKQTVTSVKIDDLTVTYTVSGNVGTNAESYTLTITANGNFTGSVTKTWSIAKATYNMNGVTFEGNTFVYNGKAHTLAIGGTLPSGVTVTYTNNGKTESGNYTVTAKFSGDGDNYNLIPDKTATLTIKQASIEKVVDGGDETKPNVVVEKEGGIDPNVKLVVVKQDETPIAVQEDIKRNEIVSAVYDIKLYNDEVEIQPNGDITIRLLVPDEANGRTFRILHLHGEKVTEVEYTIDGDYAVFTVDKLSEFTFVIDNSGSAWWLILILAVIVAAEIVLIVLKKRKTKGNKLYAAGLFGGVIPVAQIVWLVVLGVAAVALGAYVVYLYLPRKKTDEK